MSKNILQLLKVNYTLLFSVQSSHNKPTCVAFISINTIEQQRFFYLRKKADICSQPSMPALLLWIPNLMCPFCSAK